MNCMHHRMRQHGYILQGSQSMIFFSFLKHFHCLSNIQPDLKKSEIMNAKGCCKVHGARVISKNSDKKILQK